MAELGFFLFPSLEGWKSGQGCWWDVIWLPSDIPEWLWRENFERENTERTCHSPPYSSPLRCLGRVHQYTPYCLTHMCLCVCQPQPCPDPEWELLKDSSWAFFSSVPLGSTQFLACYKYSICFWRLNGWLMDEVSNSSCKCLTWDSYGARSEWSSSKLGMPLNGAIAEVVLTVLCAGYCSKGCGPLWTAWGDLQDSFVASAWAGQACRSCLVQASLTKDILLQRESGCCWKPGAGHLTFCFLRASGSSQGAESAHSPVARGSPQGQGWATKVSHQAHSCLMLFGLAYMCPYCCLPGRHQQFPWSAVDTQLSPDIFPVADLAFLYPRLTDIM